MAKKVMDKILSKEQIQLLAEQLAPILIEKVREKNHEFWIDPEQHYNAHQVISQLDIPTILALKGMVKDYSAAKGIFWKMFLASLSLAALLMAGWGMIFGHSNK